MYSQFMMHGQKNITLDLCLILSYKTQLVACMCHAFILTACWQYRFTSILPTASQNKRMTHTNCCIYIVVPPDDEQ